MEMKVVVKNDTGLHARPAAMLVQVCNKFKSEIEIKFGDKTANAKSIINLMSLGLTKGAEISIHGQGEDAKEAFVEIEQFFDQLVD